MLSNYSVKDLYALALAEGEGMGTAYEYYVKRMALSRFLDGRQRPRSILIAGLPEKYGASLDFLLLARELGASVTVVDDRHSALDRLHKAVAKLIAVTDPPLAQPTVVVQTGLDTLSSIKGRFDLILSSEVVQRLAPPIRPAYFGRLTQMSPAIALFCPNADNDAHNTISGLTGLSLDEMRALPAGPGLQVADSPPMAGRPCSIVSSGYIDMPPFPPGITRSSEQREEATSGRFEAMAMFGLGRYAHLERLLPKSLRRRQSHIVYGFYEGHPPDNRI